MDRYEKGDRFPNLIVKTVGNPDRRVSEVLKGKTVFWVLRYIGCTSCRLDVTLIKEQYDKFLEKDAQVFVVMQSDKEHVAQTLEQESFPFEIICDNDMEFYKALQVKSARSMAALAGTGMAKLMMKGAKAKEYGFEHGDFEGNELQLPALFIVDENSVITYAHYAKNIMDMPEVEDVLSFL